MSNLTSTVPGTFNAFYNLLVAAGNGQNPAIPVFHSEVPSGTLLQNGYVVLERVENHSFDPAALGSYAFYESFDVCGVVEYYLGGSDLTTMVESVLTSTWSIYQNVVMTTAVQNRGVAGQQVLGAAAPAALEWFKPMEASYMGAEGNVGAQPSGWIGQVSFRYNAYARITTA